jgi:hypothetical protein
MNQTNQTSQRNESNQMDQTDQRDQTDGALARTYQIGGVTYRLEPLSWQQNKWLGERIFRDVDVRTITFGSIYDYGREQGPLFMAICLLAEGQTRKQKSQQTLRDIEALAEEFRGELSGWEVAAFCTHFFFCCRPDQMAMLLPGRALQELFEAEAAKLSPVPGATGSSGPSSPSPTATLPSSSPSSPDGDPLIQIRTSNAASSEPASTAPSLAGAASSCPG